MSEGGYFPRRNGAIVNRLIGLAGLMAIAFGAGDFVGQWRIKTGLETDLALLRSEVAILQAKTTFHAMKEGHSKVIERIVGLESDVQHLMSPYSFRPPLGDFE